MKSVLAIVFGFVAVNLSHAGDKAVSFKDVKGGILVTIDGSPFAVYNNGKDLPKPFFSPVRAADGTILSRPLEKPEDHPHHKGVFVAVDEVNEIKFWAEKGKIVNTKSEAKTSGGVGVLDVVNEWRNLDGELVVTEKTTITIHPNRLLVYNITFVAPGHDVIFRDTKEGLFGFRMTNSMREREGGKVANADGLEGSVECWGKRTAWVDYYGPVNGKTYGVAIMDHPSNFRPSRYHVRNYGLFSVSPFGESAYTRGKSPSDPVTIKQGKTLNLKYGMYFHNGTTAEAKVGDVYNKQFLAVKGK
ncbi:MAG: PmoA family protein [Planctomycetota bacterium]|nr:PmoA family protein [Planctomycetota bacterium]